MRNLAVPGAEVANLLQLVRTDSTVQGSIAQAEAILVTIGLNDLAFNRLDDPCDVAPDYPPGQMELHHPLLRRGGYGRVPAGP